MPTVEIDEVELRRHHQLAGVVNTILSHPKAKLLVQQAHKMVDANARTPELDNLQVVSQPIVEMQQTMAAFIAKQNEDQAEREKTERINGLKNQHLNGVSQLRRDGWTDDGIKGVEKLMEEKGLLDPLDAAAIYEKSHPPQAPATPSGSGAWNFAEGITDDQAFVKNLLASKGGNDLVVEKESQQVLQEMRQASRR